MVIDGFIVPPNLPFDAMWLAVALNTAFVLNGIRLTVRIMKASRLHLRMIVLAKAYEKELEEKGVSLEQRCINCSQTLPRHADGCHYADFYLDHDRIMEFLTRPPIKYYGGKKGSAG